MRLVLQVHFFFQHYPSEAVNKLINEFKGNYHQFFMGWGFFDDALLSVAHSVDNSLKPINLLQPAKKDFRNLQSFPYFYRR